MSETPVPKRKWMRILLVASLAVNLLVVGIVAGTMIRFKGKDQARIPPGFGPALYQALPRSDQRALKGELSDMRSKGASRRKTDLSELSAALRTVPFDPETVNVLLQQQAAETASLQNALHQKWLSQVTEMSDAERAAYANKLEEIIQRGWRHKKKKH